MKLVSPKKQSSIQWSVLRQHFIATIGTVIAINLVLLLFSFVITTFTPFQERIEVALGIQFYSLGYFLILFSFLVIGSIVAFTLTIYVGLPLGRELKKNLELINDGAEAFSRGKLDHRIIAEDFLETAKIGTQFNKMANRIEKQVKSLQRLVDENARLMNQRELSVALDERRKLARELHDAVSQQLFAISMILSALPKMMENDLDRAKKSFKQVEDMVVQAQQELRALIMHLRPVTLEGISLRKGIEQLLEELKQKHEQIKWEWELQDVSLSQGVEDQLFRVLQESISNMLRHSKANSFTLKFYKRNDRIFLILEDNGIGFDVMDKKKSSYGIETMRERIEDIGGRLDIISYPNKGTRIEIRVPIKLEEEGDFGGSEN